MEMTRLKNVNGAVTPEGSGGKRGGQATKTSQ